MIDDTQTFDFQNNTYKDPYFLLFGSHYGFYSSDLGSTLQSIFHYYQFDTQFVHYN